jgi:hypothetical protein
VPHPTSRRLRRGLLALGATLALLASLPLAVGAADPQNGFKTQQPAMIVPGPGAPLETEIKPIITVGDTIGSYRYEAIPDGISWFQSGKNAATVLINHETSTVPFPYTVGGNTGNSQNDFDNSQLSRLVIRNGGAVMSASYAIASSAGLHRFCSNYLATSAENFSFPLLFTNEEGIDWVKKSGTQWPATEGATDSRQIGAVIAYNPANGASQPIWGMGRHNHENSVAVPGYGKPVVLSGDDSFNQVAAQSQVYMYIGNNATDVWNDAGTLYAFAPSVTDAAVNDYFDFPNDNVPKSISGRFIPVPKNIATGRNGSNDMISTDVGYPLPPADGTWQRGPGITSGPGVDGPQWILEHWGDLAENNVFQFLRIEDIAYDRTHPNVLYLADSGRGLRPDQSPSAGQGFRSTNGRIWKMVLSPTDPTIVTSLSILIEGDDMPVKTLGEVHQPDNLETTANGLYITEDPGSSQHFPSSEQGQSNATTARVWQYRFGDQALNPVLKVDQSADEGPTDVDTVGAGSWGAWETTGIVDASSIFGPGKFLINVQAHSLFVEIGDGPNILAPAGPDWLNKREGGQLLLVTIPGG